MRLTICAAPQGSKISREHKILNTAESKNTYASFGTFLKPQVWLLMACIYLTMTDAIPIK